MQRNAEHVGDALERAELTIDLPCLDILVVPIIYSRSGTEFDLGKPMRFSQAIDVLSDHLVH